MDYSGEVGSSDVLWEKINGTECKGMARAPFVDKVASDGVLNRCAVLCCVESIDDGDHVEVESA